LKLQINTKSMSLVLIYRWGGKTT